MSDGGVDRAVLPADETLPAPLQRLTVARYRIECPAQVALTLEADWIAEEVPVALEYNGVSHAVMMATPQDLLDFAVGFSLTEGIVERADDIYDVEVVVEAQGIRLQIDLASERFMLLKDRRRSLTGRTGCGICGAENLAQAVRQPATLAADDVVLPAALLHAAFEQLSQRQPLQQASGATHAAGWVDATGTLSRVREDVGRHNALDKLLGAMARDGASWANGAAIVTSRASVEMVQKVAALGVPILATVSGPTALAIRMAEAAGVSLAAYFRVGGHVRYTHGHRLGGSMTQLADFAD